LLIVNAAKVFLVGVVLLAAGSVYSAAPVSGLDVVIRQKSDGKVVHEATTSAQGTFTTPQLQPGTYYVEFRAKQPGAYRGSSISMSVATTAGAIAQTELPGERFNTPVAMQVRTQEASKLNGRVSMGPSGASMPDGIDPRNPNVKWIKGRKYVRVPPEVGSHQGERWVPADSVGHGSRRVEHVSREDVRRLHDRTQGSGLHSGARLPGGGDR
jgi:hypothetical protein